MKNKNRMNKKSGNQNANERIGFMLIPALSLKEVLSLSFEDKGENTFELSISLSELTTITVSLKLDAIIYHDFKKLSNEKKQSIYDSLRESIYFDLNLIAFWKLKEFDLQKMSEQLQCYNAIIKRIQLFGKQWENHMSYLICAVD